MLLSASTAQLVRSALPPEVSLIDLGEHRLRDLLQPDRIFQVEHPELAAEYPPLKTLNDRPNNLPTQTSELVRRDRELRQIRDMLADPGVRLLTLVGPGGVGKTRLAVQVGAEHADHVPDGAYFVDLSPVTDADAGSMPSRGRSVRPASASRSTSCVSTSRSGACFWCSTTSSR